MGSPMFLSKKLPSAIAGNKLKINMLGKLESALLSSHINQQTLLTKTSKTSGPAPI